METSRHLWPKLAVLIATIVLIFTVAIACAPEMVYVEDSADASPPAGMVIQHDLFTETDGKYFYTCVVTFRQTTDTLAQSCWRDPQ